MDNLQVVTREGVDTTIQTYVDLLATLYTVHELPGLKFAKKVVDNINTLEKELEPLNKILQPTDEFMALSERVRQEAGQDQEKMVAIEAEEGNKKVVEHRHEQLATARQMLENPKEITLRKINESELPQQISAKQLKGLAVILN